MSKNKGNKAVLNDTDGNIVTKYDKKVQKREAEKKANARNRKITVSVLAVIAAIAVIAGGYFTWSHFNRVYKNYIVVDGQNVNQIEYDFYYSMAKNNILNQPLFDTMTYGDYFKSYMGYDRTKSDSSQIYDKDKGYTWFDYFAKTGLDTLKEYKALIKAADEKGFNYETQDADYEEFKSNVKKYAEESEVSEKEYYKLTFGKYATASSIEEYVFEYLKAAAYQEQLMEDYKPSDEEVEEFYEKNKDDYDDVTYRSLEIKAEVEDNEEALAAAKAKADEMVSLVDSEDKFASLCKEYTTSDDPSVYDDKDASLKKDALKSSVSEDIGKWLFAAERKKGDIIALEDKTNSRYVVLYFIDRGYDEDNDEIISSKIVSDRYSEFIKPYTDAITVEDKAHRIKELK